MIINESLSLKKQYPIMVIIILAVGIHAPVWLGYVDFYSGNLSDTIPYFYGSKLLLYQTFQEFKQIPFWNPYIMLGQPVAGNVLYTLFYPLNLIFLWIPFFKALWIYYCIHMIIAGLGTYGLAVHLGCDRRSSMVAGCLYMLNGRLLYYINAGWLVYFGSICWLPLFVLTAMWIIQRNQWYDPALFGIVFAMTVLSGTPQYALLGFCLFGLQGLWNLFRLPSKSERLSLFFRLILAGLLSFLLVSVQLFPAVEQMFLSSRTYFENANTIYGFHFDWSLQQWLRILLRPEYLSHDFSWELSAYIGIGGMALALFGFVVSKVPWQHIVTWGLIPLFISMGPAFSSLSKIIASIPGISILVNPSRYFIFTILLLCISAGKGLGRFLSFESNHRPSYLFVITTGIVLFLAGLAITPYAATPFSANLRYFGAIIIFLVVAVLYVRWKRPVFRIILICWLIIDPILTSSGILTGYSIKDLQQPQKIIKAIKDYKGHARIASIQPEPLKGYRLTPFTDWFCIQNKISRAGGYEPLAMLHTLEYLNQMEGTRSMAQTMWYYRLTAFARPRLFDLAGVTHLITYQPVMHPHLKLIAEDTISMPTFCGGWWKAQPVYLYENLHVLPRAFLVAQNSEFSAIPIEFRLISPDRRQLNFQTSKPGMVVVSESFHSGWTAFEQTKPQRSIALQPFLGTFISFHVTAGEHDIILDFDPKSFHTGLQFTLTGVLLILGLFLVRKRRFNDRVTPVDKM